MNEMIGTRTVEPQYQIQAETLERLGPVELGPTASHTWRSDPRRLAFLLARYKFVSKMFAGRRSAVEFGCGDGFGMRVVLQTVGHVHGIDFDQFFIDWARRHAAHERLNCTFERMDITRESSGRTFDCAYSLDVIEHIEPQREDAFMDCIAASLCNGGACIVGTPNITAGPYASPWSAEGHINLKSAETLRSTMERVFSQVFLFSMNDEVVHTGFAPMAHYLFCLGVGPR
jgi:2-polyprenyl-3-methyl-5-hydroxy-6-metoxy-1,4-benzoquinol methylase